MNNEVLIYGNINSDSAESFIKAVNHIEGDDLVVRMDTNGGDPQATFGMVAKFNEFKGTKLLKVDGRANSSGFFFVAMVENVEALDVSEFVVHRASYPEWVEQSDKFTDELKANLQSINNSLMESFTSKIDVELFEEMKQTTVAEIFSMDTRIDVKLTAEESKKIGLIKNYIQLTPSISAEIDTKKFEVLANYKPKQESKKTVQTKVEKMTKEELQANHPEMYASIIALGVTKKEDEIKADIEKIEAEKVIKEEMRAEILAEIEAKKLNPLESLVSENAEPIIGEIVVTAELTGLEMLSAKLDAELGLIK